MLEIETFFTNRTFISVLTNTFIAWRTAGVTSTFLYKTSPGVRNTSIFTNTTIGDTRFGDWIDIAIFASKSVCRIEVLTVTILVLCASYFFHVVRVWLTWRTPRELPSKMCVCMSVIPEVTDWAKHIVIGLSAIGNRRTSNTTLYGDCSDRIITLISENCISIITNRAMVSCSSHITTVIIILVTILS